MSGLKGSDTGDYSMLTWVRFWREGNEYQLPVRMDVANIKSMEEGARYDEQLHKRCLDIIRYGRATGDFKEPIKFNDKHVITISYEDIDDLYKLKEDGKEEEVKGSVE